MKFTLAEIRWMEKGLSAITQLPLPIKMSYKLAKLLNFCTQEMIAVEQARVELVKRLSEDTNSPGEMRVTPENEEIFRTEFSQLLQEEVEMDFIPIKLSDLGDDIKLTPAELASLIKIIDDQE